MMPKVIVIAVLFTVLLSGVMTSPLPQPQGQAGGPCPPPPNGPPPSGPPPSGPPPTGGPCGPPPGGMPPTTAAP